MKRLAILTSVAALAVGLLPALPAGADGNLPNELFAPMVSVKSTGGQTLRMFLSAGKSSSAADLSMRLERVTSAGDESHTWNFNLPSSALSYSSPKGKLATGRKLGPYGGITLAFRKVSSKTQNCQGYSGATKVTTTIVKLSGRINFAARNTSSASSWGSVKKGSSSSPYTFGGKRGSYVVETNGPCKVNTSNTFPCFQGWIWYASDNGNGNMQESLEGDYRTVGSTTTSTINAFIGQGLPSPSGASRIDSVVVKAPAPQFNGSANPNTLHASTKSGTKASGGGTMTASGNSNSSPAGKCRKSNGTTTQQQNEFWSATWTNDSSKLVVKMDLGGTVSVSNGSGGYFSHYTYK